LSLLETWIMFRLPAIAAALIFCVTRLNAGDGFAVREDGRLERIVWNDSRVIGSPEPPLPYRPVRAYERLEMQRPVYLRAAPSTSRMFLLTLDEAERGPATLRTFDDTSDACESQVLMHADRQILGFAFHPNYAENGYLFAHSNGPQDAENKQNRIVRYTVDRAPPHGIVDGSETVILEWDSNGHNGGDLGFGPDGYLYCPTGDGTSDSDTLVTGQGLDDLLAVLVRIDVDHPAERKPYSIPPDNPFIHVPGARPEIWAVGFRNPWRMDYDHRLNQLWVTQNGQDLWEQVFLVRRGENYGWSVTEGSHPFYLERKIDPHPIARPTAEHHHSEARSLTGGIVYWGEKLPDLQGAYIYGDYSTGKIWAIKHDGTRVTEHREIADTTFQIVGFAQNRAGDLLVIDFGSGIYRLEPTPPVSNALPFPRRLSETGVFTSVAGHVVHPALIPYSVNVELWSDGAHKERWMGIPGQGKIRYSDDRGWDLPEGTVLVKSFALEREAGRPQTRRWIETRLLTRQQGEWVGYSYQWNDEQTDAELIEATGRDVEFAIADPSAEGGVRRQSWHYPTRAECMVCHSRAAKYVLGVTTHQLNRSREFSIGPRNQVELYEELGLYDAEMPAGGDSLPKLAALDDPSASLDLRARSYLHANCSFCHVAAGGGNSAVDFEIVAKPDKALMIDAPPVHTTFGIEDARIVAPGSPQRSIVMHRISRRGQGQMPPLASSIVDELAVAVIRQWIEQLPPPEIAGSSPKSANVPQ
jgi:uncharacterized repeat protein (TIGR03806 family)